MSTPDGHSGPYEPGPDHQGHATRPPGEDVPRQQAAGDERYDPGYDPYGEGQGPYGQGQGPYAPYPPDRPYGSPRGGYDPGWTRARSYLEGAPVAFGQAVQNALRHMFTYRGRASRSAFWWYFLLQVIVSVLISLLSNDSRAAGITLDIIIGIPITLAGIALAVRRLHDTDRRGWWWFIGFIPIVGGIILLVFYALPGTPRPNRFDEWSRR